MAPSRDKWVRRFVITETSRHKRGFTIYKVTSLVFLKTSPDVASKVSVWKRYNDLKKLHKSLGSLSKSLNIREKIPSFPKGKFFSRFEAEVIKERRDSAIKLLEFVGRHPALFTSDIFVKFFETSLQLDNIDCNESIGSDTSEESQVSSSSRELGGNLLVPEKLYANQKSLDRAGNLSPARKSPQRNLSPRTVPISSSILEPESPETSSSLSPTILRSETLENLGSKSDDFGQYVLIAAAHMSAGYRHESMSEYEEAFMQYKLGITNLSHGVQVDPDPERRKSIHSKIKKYTDRAEALYNRYLNSNIALLNKPSDDLKNYKVIKILNSVMLVRDTRTNVERIIKTIEKPSDEKEDISSYILRGNAPFMVRLHGFVQTDMAVFLILHYIRTGRLWETIRRKYGIEQKSSEAAIEKVLSVHDLVAKPSDVFISEDCDTDIVDENVQEPQNHATDVKLNLNNNKDLPTNQLLEKAQELLKSVDATIKKSNSIADRLNERNLSASSTRLDISTEKKSFISDYDDNLSESEFSITDSSSGSFEKVNLSDVYINNYDSNRDYSKLNIYERTNAEASEDSGVEMEQELWRIPESVIRHWSAQIILTLEFLHRQDVVMKNLRPQNLLIDEDDNVVLCYVVPKKTQQFSVRHKAPYAAPELCNYLPDNEITAAVDIWSLGIILYELLTGIEFQARHTGPYYSHSILSIPNDLSDNAKSLLRSIIIFEPSERFTLKDLKNHPFFEKINWETIVAANSQSIIEQRVA